MSTASPDTTHHRHTQGSPAWLTTRDGRRLFSQSLDGPSRDGVTVVFEAGAAANRSVSADVQTRVAAMDGVARSVVYDRSGLGRSAPDPDGRTLSRMADDLNDVLDRLGGSSFVLVGHSAGGPLVRLAASRHPGRVAGLVLVDPTDEAIGEMGSPWFRALELVVGNLSLLLAKLGLVRRMFAWLMDAAPADDVRGDMAAEAFGPEVFRTQLTQSRTFMPEVRTWRSTPPDLGDIPVTIVAGAKPGDGMSEGNRRSALAAYEQRAAASKNGRLVLAENSAHYVPVTDAGLLAEEIGRLC
ncbi:MAG: alpha/beta fold hydrolase [Mycobacteriaceae bacterium]|uniref:alpha/beta fold hydrolase n=1 Tax=Corynebacterium sp. TaxID=1720 RepID=UPI003F99F5EC